MVRSMSAQIFKSEDRGKNESEIFTRFSTFNFDDYSNDSRKPFGALQVINDETIGEKNKIFRHIEDNTEIIIIPLFGALVYKDSLGNEDIIETEQIRILSAEKGMSYELLNPYPDGLVNYLQIWINPKEGTFKSKSIQSVLPFSRKNTLFPLFTNANDEFPSLQQEACGCIGIYENKKEGKYKLANSEHGIFAFVISGAFEFEDRLIETKDGLSISGISEVTFEALSENAVLLVFEIPL